MFSVIPILWINPTSRTLSREPGRLAQRSLSATGSRGGKVSTQQITLKVSGDHRLLLVGKQIAQNGDISFFQRLVPNQFFR